MIEKQERGPERRLQEEKQQEEKKHREKIFQLKLRAENRLERAERRRGEELQHLLREEQRRVAKEKRLEEEVQHKTREEQRRVTVERLLKKEGRRRRKVEVLLKKVQQQARQQAEKTERQRDQARQQVVDIKQSLSFEELLKNCHRYLHKSLIVEENLAWATKGFTRPNDRYRPQKLMPWKEFSEKRQKTFNKVHRLFHSSEELTLRVFKPALFYELIGSDIRHRKLGSELDLNCYERASVEDVVTQVIDQLCEIPAAREAFNLREGVSFENHPNSFHQPSKQIGQGPPQTPRRTSQREESRSSISDDSAFSHPRLRKALPDQFCVWKTKNDNNIISFLVEYKPPHKLTVEMLAMGLQELNLDNWLKGSTMPSHKKEGESKIVTQERLQYNAEKLVTAALTQTFDYMILMGVEYGYITTGEAFVFLHIREDDATTLYYHLSVPVTDIAEAIEDRYAETAIGQVLSFSLMASESKQRSSSWRDKAKSKLSTWVIDFEEILRKIPESDRKPATPVSAYKARINPNPRTTPVRTRAKDPKKATAQRSRCDSADTDSYIDEDDSEDLDTPSRSAGRVLNMHYPGKNLDKAKGKSIDRHDSTGGNDKGNRQYCTQNCLLGMVRGLRLDEKCPNVTLHRRGGNHHQIGLKKFTELVQEQLIRNLDDDCEPLGLQGARGALFKLALTSHGYTFVGKGTVKHYIPALLHEGRVYDQLKDVQGTTIPVYLGSIDLSRGFYLYLDVDIIHMLLLSYGGEMVNSSTNREEMERTETEIRRLGVDQGDVRWANMLWNEEKKRVMLIDFERATYLVDETRPALGELPLNTTTPLPATAVANPRQTPADSPPNHKRKRDEPLDKKFKTKLLKPTDSSNVDHAAQPSGHLALTRV